MIPSKYNLLIPQGTSYELALTLLTGEQIKTTAAATPIAGVADIPCQPLKEALSLGTRLYFLQGATATVSEALTLGATTLKVSNLFFPIAKGATAQRIADLTGCQARSQIKKAIKDATALAEFTPEFAIDRLSGVLKLSLAETDTRALLANIDLKTALALDEDLLQERSPQTTDYTWDLEIIYSNGKVERPLNGIALVSPETTTPQT